MLINPINKTKKYCGACASNTMEAVCIIPYYIENTKKSSEIRICKSCGSYRRFIERKLQKKRFAKTYNEPLKEMEIFERRKKFYAHILKIGKKYTQKHNNMLDYGCSFGHLMKIFKLDGFKTIGIEPHSLKHNSEIYETLDKIPSLKFDVITAIDVFYYLEDPIKILKQLSELLDKDGIIILRISNRTLLLKLYHKLTGMISYNLFGDHIHEFSLSGIKSLTKECGVEIVEMLFQERGKNGNLLTDYLLKLTEVISFSPIKIYPGLTLILKKKI